jgi:hypothetical protein
VNDNDTFAPVPNWLSRRPDVSSTAKLLYGRLLQYQGNNATAWPGIGTLATEIGKSPRRVIDTIAVLEHLHLLRVERRVGYRASNRYHLLTATSAENSTSAENGTSDETSTRTSAESCTSLVPKAAPKENKKKSVKRSGTPPTSARWTKPELPELEAYALEIGLPATEVPKFVDHYNSNGWKIGGRSPMKDWQAALRNWKRNRDEWGGSKTHATTNRNTNTYNDGKADAYATAAR